MSVGACEATRLRGEQSDDLLDLRMSCLRTRLVELRTLGELLVHADAELVLRSVTAAGSLAPIDDCADIKALTDPVRPPRDPAGRARAETLADELAAGRARFEAGDLDHAATMGATIVNAARQLGHPPTLGRALFLLGAVQHRSGDAKTAEATLREAMRSAEAGRDDQTKLQAMTVLLLALDTPGRADDAIALAQDARAVIQRLGGNDELEASLLDNLGVALRGDTCDSRLRIF